MIVKTELPAHAIAGTTPFPAFAADLDASLGRLERAYRRLGTRELPLTPETAWGTFNALPVEKRAALMRSWVSQAEFLEGAFEEGLHSVDETGMLRYAMDYFKLMGDSDLFAQIERDDLIEILNPELLQVYRSFNYFDLCNYSLVELGVYPFYELYERSSQVESALLDAAEKLLGGKAKWIDLFSLPSYTIRERMTQHAACFSMRDRLLFKTRSMLSGETYIISLKKVQAMPLEQLPTDNLRFL